MTGGGSRRREGDVGHLEPLRVLMVGPAPAVVGGMSTVAATLVGAVLMAIPRFIRL